MFSFQFSKKTLTFALAIVGLTLLFAFVLWPLIRQWRNEARLDQARQVLLRIRESQLQYRKSHQRFSDNLSDLTQYGDSFTKSSESKAIDFGFNPSCLRTSGVANFLAHSEPLMYFHELPCATAKSFTALAAVSIESGTIDIFIARPTGPIAHMRLAEDQQTEIETFRLFLQALK